MTPGSGSQIAALPVVSGGDDQGYTHINADDPRQAGSNIGNLNNQNRVEWYIILSSCEGTPTI